MSIGLDVSPVSLTPIGSDGKPRELTEEEQSKKDEVMEKVQYLSDCKLALSHAKDSRRRYDYEWMVRDLFRRGYQFSKYQPNTQTVVLASRQSARIPINITLAQMRSIRNQVTSFRPKFEVMPRNTTTASTVNARYSQKLLDYYFDHLNLKKKIKETVIQGLEYSVGGPWQVVYDEEKKEVNVWLIDPFDFYFDPLAESLEEAEFCIKAVRRPLTEVIYNPEYNKGSRKEITGGEGRLAVSEYKQFMLQALKETSHFDRAEAPTVILFEGYFRIRDEETGKPHLRKVVWTDQNMTPLIYEDLDTNDYDFAIYHADINPKEILGESWMKHVMPINRVINSLESSVYDYNYRVAKGRIVVDKDSGVKSISNVHGEIISKNRGAEVRALDMPSLPVATSMQIERMNRYIEDIGGAHDASLGRIPPGVKSGIGIAELKQSDATSQDDLVDNLEDFLTLVAQKMLKKIAENYSTKKVIQDLGYKDEQAKYFAVIGEKYASKLKKNPEQEVAGHEGQVKIGPDWLDIAVIGKENNIRVTIGSWLGYTKEMMQEKLIKYLQLGAIDQKTFLTLSEFGDIDKIVQQTRTEMILKAQLARKTQEGTAQVDPYVENDMMVLEGKAVMPDQHDDHWVHVAVHQEALGLGRDDLVGQHIAAHQMFMGEPVEEAPVVQPEIMPDMGGVMPEMAPEDLMRDQQVQAQQPAVPGSDLGQSLLG
ncbi:hypothetical protein M0R04_13475 [Candidatus Dojkabacteria bacterium]|jgi:hypothetical protein|nr:hypothetical protein [Candidatus Dojkabacteria bacterium]